MTPELTLIPLNVSTKYIIPPENKTYTTILMDKTCSFVRRMRWRAYHLDNPTELDDHLDTYGFKSRATPPPNILLSSFEHDMFDLVKHIQFRKNTSVFQKELVEKMNTIKRTDGVHVHSDKTGNLYQMTKATHHNFIQQKLTAEYRKSNEATLDNINTHGLRITMDLKISDRTEPFSPRTPFFSVKDHKPNFINNPSIRLISPTKSDVGIISKKTLDRIIPNLTKRSRLPLWINTTQVIEWFKSIPSKRSSCFISFDIDSYYPSITKSILDEAITFAQTVTPITTSEIDIILQARQTLIGFGTDYWKKRNSLTPFDVTMGANDSAQVTDLVGIHILHRLSAEFPQAHGGLYRDDGLLILRETNPQRCDQIRKRLHAMFRDLGFTITVSSNIQVVDFLDVTLNLINGLHYPYHKPNETLNYIHTSSSHPKFIIKNLVHNISRRISTLSANEAIFHNYAHRYNDALTRSGFTDRIFYIPPTPKRHKPPCRTRHITWFNPPFSINVVTPIAAIFFRILRTHFPTSHKYYRIFNKNTVKLAYSTTPNIAQKISMYNNKKLNHPGDNAPQDTPCNL